MDIDIDFWLWSLNAPADRLKVLAEHLSGDESARAARFVQDKHGREYRAARGRLREILAGYIGAPPGKLQFLYNAHGKPYLEGGPFFNLSHAGGHAVLVVCEDAEVGVDIEIVRDVEPGVPERFFSSAENAALNALPEGLWDAGFLRCWTRKEAILKARGVGLSQPLDSFDVTLEPSKRARVTRIDGGNPDDWTLRHINLGPLMLGAIAIEAKGRPVHVRPKGDFFPRGIF